MNLWRKFVDLKYQTKLYIFYSLSAVGVIYFLYDISVVTNALSNNQLYFTTPQDTINIFQPNSITYDYNLTIGGAIWRVALDMIQIMFFVSFMLMLYVHEVFNGKSK